MVSCKKSVQTASGLIQTLIPIGCCTHYVGAELGQFEYTITETVPWLSIPSLECV